MSKFNDAWDEIFDRYHLLSKIEHDGFCDISAEAIKAVSEPRLLTKQDHRRNRPIIFQQNKLNILPLSRSMFRIGRIEVFHDFENSWNDASDDIICVDPCNLDSIDFNNITSEAIAIRSLACTKMLNDFLSEDNLCDTVAGRMKSGMFDFRANNLLDNKTSLISVRNAQMEIDGGYESQRCLCLIESKLNLADDFNIRQLYYPYRYWLTKVDKQIRPVFFIYSNGIYHVMEYKFDIPGCMNSLRCIRYKKYMIDDKDITLDQLCEISNSTPCVSEPGVPFPQADSLERVINLCIEMARRKTSMSKDEIWLFFSFTDRQADYYANAGIYLGLIEKVGRGEYNLSVKGKIIFGSKKTIRQRNLMIARQLLEHGVINDCFRWSVRNYNICDKYEFERIIRKHTECNIGESLYGRRSSTIRHWIKWLINLVV